MTSLTLKASRPNRKQILPALPLAVLACATALPAQTAPQPSAPRPAAVTAAKNPGRSTPLINRNVVVLDPSHGGPEPGARLADQAVEKAVTLAVASSLRQGLAAAGFTVVSTRDADPQTPLTPDQRAELANRQHAAACLVLHVTSTGSGVHLYISGVQPTPPPPDDPDMKPPFEPTPWEMAQAGSAIQSLHLQNQLFSALNSAGLATLRGRGNIRPLDNLTCPAVIVEIAPLGPAGSARTAVTDSGYQQRLVQALTTALQHWRDSLPARQKPTPLPAAHPAAPAGGPQ